jgi:hypothetical protein
MTVVAVEQLQTRSYAFSGGSTTGSRLFTVYDDATTIDNPQSIVDLFGSNGIPYRGEPFPSIYNLFAKAYRIETRAGSMSIFERGSEVDRASWTGCLEEMIAIEIRPEALRSLMPESDGELHLQTQLSSYGSKFAIVFGNTPTSATAPQLKLFLQKEKDSSLLPRRLR